MLEQGVEQYPESVQLHADITAENYLAMLDAKDRRDWGRVVEYGGKALEYCQKVLELSPGYGNFNLMNYTLPSIIKGAERNLGLPS